LIIPISALATAIAVVVVVLLVAGRASRVPVSVYPLAGSRASLPQTQIAFEGVSRGQLGPIVVTGTSSGRHSGTVRADSDGDGASFIPAKPFRPGERVTVRTRLRIQGGRRGTFRFTIARPSTPVAPMALPVLAAPSRATAHFHSRPDLDPATVTVDRDGTPADEGDLFVAPQNGPTQDGPMIVDPEGRLVWFKPFPVSSRTLITDFRVQNYLGKRVLTWWQGYTNQGTGRGEGVIYDEHYRQVATVKAADGLAADLHEFLVTRQGDAYVTAFSPVSVPGVDKPVMDCVVQEIDIRTGLVLFEWHALDHVPLKDSDFTPKSPGHIFDPYHINSIWPARDGNLIVSMRDTSAIYKIDRRTGKILWTLGGKASSFKMGPGTRTALQHDAILHSDGALTIFDDGAGPPQVHSHSRGIRIKLNTRKMTATLVREYDHDPPTLADFEGSVQLLQDGNVVIGWGQQPYVSEDNAAGRQIYAAHFTSRNSTYRAYRSPWSATPAGPPAVNATRSSSGTAVYTSWNGDTEVARWRVLGGPGSNHLRALKVVAQTGFETQISVPEEQFVQTQALSASGVVLGSSPVTRAR
jgi:hypothetical protein